MSPDAKRPQAAPMPTAAQKTGANAAVTTVQGPFPAPDELLTIKQVLKLLGGVAESTFYRWRQLGKAPRAIKLPNGDVRIRRSEYERWLGEQEEAA